MPNVVSILSTSDHSALKKRAKLHRRSLGSQLAYEAFEFLKLQPPAYLNDEACEGVGTTSNSKKKGKA